MLSALLPEGSHDRRSLLCLPGAQGVDYPLSAERGRWRQQHRQSRPRSFHVEGREQILEAGDHATRELLEHIVEDEERHVDWLEAQLHKIGEVGYETYLAQQIYERS